MNDGPVTEELGRWHRLHPLSPLVRAGRALVGVVVIAIPQLSSGRHQVAVITDVVILVLLLVAGLISWAVTRWRIEGGDLRIETGLLRRSSQRYPLRQVQAIDVVASGVARMLGLAELRLRMAGGSSLGRLACLPAAQASALRARLLALAAAGPPDESPADESPAAPEIPDLPTTVAILAVPVGKLLASIALSAEGAVAIVLVSSLLAIAAISPGAAAGALGGLSGAVGGLGLALWRRFNGDYGLTVHVAPDGLRLRSGLVQTTAETLLPGRVQALRVTEPLLWRPLGWCRVEAAVAGKADRQEAQAEGRRRRALLPVGSYAQAWDALRLVVPDPPIGRDRPPGRARWKAPLGYHNLSFAENDSCIVTTSGRLRRVSHWVPLARVQSLRRVAGPVQQRLRLASVHLDTAGPRMRAAVKDRDAAEADRLIRDLPGRCARAREASAVSRVRPPNG